MPENQFYFPKSHNVDLNSSNIIEAAFSPIMTQAAFVFAPTNLGITEASATLSLLTP